MKKNEKIIVFVAGLSGAGRSSVLNSLEDLHFSCMDHIPVDLLEPALNYFESNKRGAAIAVGLDIQSKVEAKKFIDFFLLKKPSVDYELLFLEAGKDVLKQRFNQTRRRHPFLMRSDKSLEDAINDERNVLEPLIENATCSVDTSFWSLQQLARFLEARYQGFLPIRKLLVNIFSFGFKNGRPENCDLVFDVRCLNNPFYDPKMRDLTGLDPAVKAFINTDEKQQVLFKALRHYVAETQPFYFEEGKQILNIGVGCTGGKHRSVFIAQKLFESLTSTPSKTFEYSIEHRDIKLPS